MLCSFAFIGGYMGIEQPNIEDLDSQDPNNSAKAWVCIAVADLVVFLATLTIGILAVCNVLPGMSPVAAYSLLGVSGLIAVGWIILLILSKGKLLGDTTNAIGVILCGCLGNQNPV